MKFCFVDGSAPPRSVAADLQSSLTQAVAVDLTGGDTCRVSASP